MMEGTDGSASLNDGERLYRWNGTTMIYWAVESHIDGITMRWGQVGGTEQEKTEEIHEGKAGRTQEQQIALRLESLYKKKVDIGYKEDPEQARQFMGTNASGEPKPMLATPFKKYKKVISSYALQRKYDGHRCLTYRAPGGNRAYSRRGLPITSLRHITPHLELPDGFYLDGELYHHGTKLQTISSWVKRSQANTSLLTYIVYDVIIPNSPDMAYRDRYQALREVAEFFPPHVQLAPTLFFSEYNVADVNSEFATYRREGYEGAIIRRLDMPYKSGGRAAMIKVKAFEDEEFTVVGMNPSKDGWAILTCDCGGGNTFDVSAPGDVPEKHRIMECGDEYIGQRVKVEFADRSHKGIPIQPTAVMWRNVIE